MRMVLLILMSVMFLASNSQSDGNKPVSGKLPALPLVFDQKEFGDRFSVLFASDDNYDYYVIDLTKLGSRFERVYFMNLTYADPRVVNIDADIEKDQTWFKSYYKNTEDEITCLLKDLKEKTDETRIGMTAEEKSAWMVKNDKFKKSHNNE
jgi:hypothetical protein